MGRLLMTAWLSRMAAWMAMTSIVLGRQVPSSVVAAGAQQDDHLDQLR